MTASAYPGRLFGRMKPVTFKISKGFPPDEEWPIAEIHEEVDGGINTPAIVRIEGGERRVMIYDKAGQIVWDYPLNAFVDALRQAESSLGDHGP
jgi:hypothetical protein